MHIERIRLKDIGPFDDVTIELPKGSEAALADVYLLTGPNGTGKSTILYALASVIAGDSIELGHDMLVRRMRSESAVAAIASDDGQIFAAAHNVYSYDAGLMLASPFGQGELHQTISGREIDHYEHGAELPRYSKVAAELWVDAPSHQRPVFSWAAFAYAGIRSVSDVRIIAIQEPKNSPFENSLSFLQPSDTNQLANWIASQNFRRLKAKESGNDERAERLARTIRTIESAIAEIIGDPGFGFVITDEDDDVRVRWNGRVVRLGLLPDGLKSIVSWVADLLMRLDRIPWVNDVPVMQRSFLLLLDEIDIHLHPSWQRRVLPLVQRMFPNAQVIASTHSPFVVASAVNACVITLGLRGPASFVQAITRPEPGAGHAAVLRTIFGLDSEIDVDIEQALQKLPDA
jgi:predicted ATP-binding protein involved in virulence